MHFHSCLRLTLWLLNSGQIKIWCTFREKTLIGSWQQFFSIAKPFRGWWPQQAAAPGQLSALGAALSCSIGFGVAPVIIPHKPQKTPHLASARSCPLLQGKCRRDWRGGRDAQLQHHICCRLP